MNVNMRISVGLALLMATAMLPATMATLPPPAPECANRNDDDAPDGRIDGADPDCDSPIDNDEDRRRGCQQGHPSSHAHTYGTGGSAGGRSDTVTGGDDFGAGVVTVSETNTADCDGDGAPGDYDGDFETGVGGGSFGFGPWADEPICNYALTTHGASVVVNDIVWGSAIAFVTGADDTSGPTITPVTDPTTGEPTGEFTCSTDGSITPGDPATDPTADADDCLSDVFVGSGSTCGAGGDGGYWVFLNGAFVTEGAGGVGASNAPTAGTITA